MIVVRDTVGLAFYLRSSAEGNQPDWFVSSAPGGAFFLVILSDNSTKGIDDGAESMLLFITRIIN
jgi:hypothetical protein